MDTNNFKKINTPRYTKEGLFPSQIVAMDKICDWYEGSKLSASLIGWAGTGKTYIIKKTIKEILKKSFIVSAPTHKALRVVNETLGFQGKTIHSLLGLRPDVDLANFDIENPIYSQKNEPAMPHFHTVIIDEASMINRSLYKRITDISERYQVKVLWVGDPLQLEPVNEGISPVFSETDVKILLKEIVRQEEGNPLLELFPLIRQDIIEGTSKFLNHIIRNRKNMNDTSGYHLMDTIDFKNKINELYESDDFKNNVDYLRTTAFTNTAVSGWNKHIRAHIISPTAPIIHHDDLLTSYNTLVNRFKEPILTNSEDYLVENTRQFTTDMNFETFPTQLASIYSGNITEQFLIIDHTDRNFQYFLNILDLKHREALEGKPGGWVHYYNFKNRYLTMIDTQLPRSKKKIKRDIDYGYALTTHKLQGSTLENIAIDLTDIVYPTTKWGNKKPADANTRNRLIYVALSRAKHFVYMKY